MISKRMEDLINDQFNKELYSSHLYLSMCSYFLDRDLDGFANFFRIQAQEEMAHAMKQFEYLHQVDGTITMKSVDAPETSFKSIKHAFEISLAHEQSVTASIGQIVKAAIEENDFATHTFFQWFITEQVEEEDLIKGYLSKINMVGDNSSALYLLNDELLKRSYTPEAGA